MTTSLVISSRERHDFLRAVTESVLAGDRRPDDLVVIDQSPTVNEAMLRLAEAYPDVLHYYRSNGRGSSSGRKEGITRAKGEWLTFLDDDVVVPRDWFRRMEDAAFAAGPRSLVTGKVVAGDDERRGAFAPSLSLSDERVVHRGRPGRDVLSSGNMAIHRQAFEEIGLFDARLGVGSRYPSSEDNDLGFRLLEAGYKIIYDPSIVVVHRAWRRPRDLLPLRWRYGRGQGAYFAKHASLRDPYMLRRFRDDLWRHVRRAPRRGRENLRNGVADIVYGSALVVGAVQWLIRWPRR